MNTYENIIMRTEQLMNRSKNIANMECLSNEDNMEAKSLMETLVKLAELQNSYPQHTYTEYANDDYIKKMNKYYIWFECLN